MKKVLFLASAVIFLLSISVCAFAHSGPLVNGEPAYTELDATSFATISSLHNEPASQSDPHKGWWYVTLTNKTTKPWAKITIKPGAGDLVAIAEGTYLEDDEQIHGPSIWASKGGSMDYSIPLGDGSRTYDNGKSALLWGKAVFTFDTSLATNQKITFKIFTDNSYYTGPWADSFSMTLTPTAVPEPSSLLVLMGGLGTFVGFARRKK